MATDFERRRLSTDSENERLRAIFAEDAERYDRARPGYPAAMYDDLVAMTGIGPGSRVLEIGCGTGQATVPLARLGCQIVAVELGAELAELARRNLAAFPDVEVVTAAFESWPLPPEPLDLVISATAFHWIDPAVRVVKSAEALRPGGVLATVATHHVAGGSIPFFAEMQACYERWDPATPKGLRLQPAEEIPMEGEEIERSGLFSTPEFHRYPTDIPYTRETYIDVLLTYSGHRAMPPDDQRGLLDCIGGLIDERYGGRIVKRYLTELRTAHRLPNG
jgi:SAM-dependent methyltransferase